MAARMIIVPGAMPARDANGRSLPSKFRFYLPDTTTPATVYTDEALSVPHAFPILSDSAGRWPAIWADEASSFSVGWSDQVYDQTIAVFSGVRAADDAVLISADIASDAADTAVAAAAAAAASAVVAAAAAGGVHNIATSTTSVTISAPATKVFTLVEADRGFATGMDVVMADSVTPTNRMVGEVVSYVGQVLTVSVTATPSGSGSHSAWTISQTTIGGVASVAGLAGAVSGSALKTALAITADDLTDIAALRGQIIALAAAL